MIFIHVNYCFSPDERFRRAILKAYFHQNTEHFYLKSQPILSFGAPARCACLNSLNVLYNSGSVRSIEQISLQA